MYCILNTDSRTRGYSMKLLKESRLNISKFFFSNQGISCWNSLPNYVIAAESINSLKIRLDNY